MENNTRLDGRRTQHVGVLSDGMWSAHDRGVGDKGVPASTSGIEQKATK